MAQVSKKQSVGIRKVVTLSRAKDIVSKCSDHFSMDVTDDIGNFQLNIKLHLQRKASEY